MPLLRNNMPLSRNKDGLLSMQKYLYIFIEKIAEKLVVSNILRIFVTY